MEKRKLSALPRPEATAEMVEMADRLDGMEHIVTAELVDDNKILLLNFYEVSKLKKGKTEAAFRTFLSSDDYITQDLSQSKVKWLTAAFDNMQGFRLWEYKWDQKTWKSEHIPKVFIWTAEDKGIMESFFKAYRKDTDENVWQSYRIPLLISILQERMLRLCTRRIRKSSVWKFRFRSTSTHCRYRNSRQRFLAKQELLDLSFIIRYQCFLHTEFKEEMTL